MNDRLSWDHYFMQFARTAAERGTCSRARVGAVIVMDRNIVATGYNGAPAGLPHCTDVGCLEYTVTNPFDQSEDRFCWRTIHAEINAITQAAKNGVSIRGAQIYVTHSPCFHCCKTILNSGIYQIVYEKPYRLASILPMIEQSGQVTLKALEPVR